MSKTYKVTVSMDEFKTEVDDCDNESEAIDRVLDNDILGCGILEFEVEEIDKAEIDKA